MSSKYCVIIPAFDAAATIGDLVRRIRAQGLDVVVVNDGSRDGTERAASAEGVVVISHLRNFGKGVALRTGFQYALRRPYVGVITMDSDDQHDPAELPRLLEAAASADVVVGNRMEHDRVMPLARRWTNRLMSHLVSHLTRQYIPDSQCGFRIIRREVLEATRLEASRFELETELLLRAAKRGCRVVSVPIQAIYDHQRSHIRPIRDTARFLGTLLRILLTT